LGGGSTGQFARTSNGAAGFRHATTFLSRGLAERQQERARDIARGPEMAAARLPR